MKLVILLTITLLLLSLPYQIQAQEAAVQFRNRPIVFSLELPNQVWRIYSMTLNGAARALTPRSMTDAGGPAWSPRGDQIAFSANGLVYVMNADGFGLHALTSKNIESGGPVWSPDGKHIAFSCYDPKNLAQSRSVRENEGLVFESYWGARLAFARSAQNPDGVAWTTPFSIPLIWREDGVCTMNSDGTDLRVLTKSDEDRGPLAWSHDGKKIAFWADSTSRDVADVYTMNTDGSAQTDIGITLLISGAPWWSPDDKWLAFDGGNGKRTDIYRVGADGSDLTNLTENLPGSSMATRWSPDGHYIAFRTGHTADDDALLDLGILKFDGTTPIIARWWGIGGGHYDLAWSPDSTRLAYVSHVDSPDSSASISSRLLVCLSQLVVQHKMSRNSI